MTGGTANWETAAAGRSSVTQPFSKNQSIMTSLIGNRSGYSFVLWNTKPDGTGEELSEYNNNHNGCQGPVTFYAIYFKSDYVHTGSQQIFTAPVSGWYKVQLWGARGGYDSYEGGAGGYAEGEINLTAGQSVYVYVGSVGQSSFIGNVPGYNGGGRAGSHDGSGTGGGATDIRVLGGAWDAAASLNTRIMVAGGAGGGAMRSAGGCGGGLAGGSAARGGGGGTQTSGGGGGVSGSFGKGANNGYDGGGGGGGWYGGGAVRTKKDGDYGGGGGSSYIGGYGSIIPRNARTIAGNQQMPDYDGGMMTGNMKPCLARFTLIEKNVH